MTKKKEIKEEKEIQEELSCACCYDECSCREVSGDNPGCFVHKGKEEK